MRDASSAFNHGAMNGNVVTKALCTLTDGSTIEFGPSDIVQGGVSVTSGTSNSGSFGIGCAIIGRCTIRLRNDNRQLNGLNLSGAHVTPYVGVYVGDAGDADEDGYEWLKLGEYWVEPFDMYDNVVTLSCLDALSKLELPCTGMPATQTLTLAAMAKRICTLCGLTLAAEDFPNGDYVVINPSVINGKSCIEALSYIAQACGCYVVADEDGEVRFGWYSNAIGESGLDGGGFHFEVDTADGGGFHFDVSYADGGAFALPYSITALKSLSAGVASHVVTGLAVSATDGTQAVEGEDGYVLHIKDNPLVGPQSVYDIAPRVAPRVVGRPLRKVRVSMPGSPVMQAGDAITVIDRFGEHYDFWATSVTWSATGTLTASCDAESSSPLVRTYRKQEYDSTSDPQLILKDVLNKHLADLAVDFTGFDDIENKFDDIDSDIGGINTSIGGLNSTVGRLSTDIGTLSTNLNNLSSRVDGINTTVGGLNANVSNLSTDVSNLSTDVSNLDTDIGNLDTRVERIEQSSSVGQWVIKVNDVVQTTGTINFVT